MDLAGVRASMSGVGLSPIDREYQVDSSRAWLMDSPLYISLRRHVSAKGIEALE